MNSTLPGKLYLCAVAAGWAIVAIIVAASLLNPPVTGLDIPQEDKWGHLIAYGTLMGWFTMLYRSSQTRLYYFLGFAVMGGALELIQGTMAHRQASVADLIANVSGLTLGWFLASRIWSQQQR